MAKKQYVWFDGKFVDFEKANVHILTHSLQYGSGIFEGIRAYPTEKGPAIFRLKDHARRFLNSAKIVHMNLGLKQEQIEEAIKETARKNGLESCYIRPFAFYNDNNIGLAVTGKKVSVAVAAVEFGNYFGEGERGLRCKVSTWLRLDPRTMPLEAKQSGNYANSLLASNDAKLSGCDEAIMLSTEGYVAEGPAENIFLVDDGKLLTPSKDSDILLGITRDSILKFAESMGLETEEREVHKEELYTCDEAFFSGTAAEITPIVSIDSTKLGNGKQGPITKMLSDKYASIVHGKDSEYLGWLTYV